MDLSQTGPGKKAPLAMDAKARRARLRELKTARAALNKVIDDAKNRRAELDAERRALQGSAGPKAT